MNLLKKIQAAVNRHFSEGSVSLAAFFTANLVKIVAFNLFILPYYEKRIILYKLAFTPALLLPVIVVLFLFRRPTAFSVFYLLQSIYVAVNILYVSFYHHYLHIVQTLRLFSEGLDAATHLGIPDMHLSLLAFIDLPFFILAMWNYGLSRKFIKRRKRYVAGAVLTCAIVTGLLEVWNQRLDVSLSDLLDCVQDGETRVVERYGSLINSIADIFRNDEKSLIASLHYGRKRTNLKERHRSNILIVQVESLNAAVVWQNHDGKPLMKYLRHLATHSVYYPLTVSYHFGGGTSDCEFSSLNSVEPLENFPAIKLLNYDYANAIPRQFHNEGYETAAFHGNRKSYYNRDIAFQRMGYDTFYGRKDLGLKPSGWGVADGDLFGAMLEKIKKARGNFFYHAITITSHTPFETVNDTPFSENRFDDVTGELTRSYAKSMSYVDDKLEMLVEGVRRSNPDTCIIIYGDHCPNIFAGEFTQASLTYDDRYFEFVPLFIVTPDNKRYFEKRIVASFLDVAPTLLDASGIAYTVRSDGIDLLDPQLEGTLPFRGKKYKREDIFRLAESRFGDPFEMIKHPAK